MTGARLTPREAYLKGWAASERTTTYDLGAAEDRFERTYGPELSRLFSDGWIDHASDYARFASRPELAS